MLTEKRKALASLLESREGIHVSIYIENSADPVVIQRQLIDAQTYARAQLEGAVTPAEIEKLLQPVRALEVEPTRLMQMSGNIGVFRTARSFRVISVPVELDFSCSVASTFHVKPLLRWIQSDQDFLVLSIKDTGAELYIGSQTGFRKLDTVSLEAGDDSQRVTRIEEWLKFRTLSSTPRLFVTGSKKLAQRFLKQTAYSNLSRGWTSGQDQGVSISDLCEVIRMGLESSAQDRTLRDLLEFQWAEGTELIQSDLRQIARSAVRGDVRKLLIADQIEVFGRIDRASGELEIHSYDRDHEDDDILDDLAQIVLAVGGEVVVAPRSLIPKGRLAVALLSVDRDDRIDFAATLSVSHQMNEGRRIWTQRMQLGS